MRGQMNQKPLMNYLGVGTDLPRPHDRQRRAIKMSEAEDLAIQDTTGLTDADWAEINKLRNAHKKGGAKAVGRAMQQLAKDDPVRYVRVIGAFYPDMIREEIKDSMAERGITEEDIREILQNAEQELESVSGTKH